MIFSDERLKNIERANYFRKYRKLAEEGNFAEALEFNQKAYEFFWDLYRNEEDNEFKAKIKIALDKIVDDGIFLKTNTQLNIAEEKQ